MLILGDSVSEAIAVGVRLLQTFFETPIIISVKAERTG